MPSDLEKRFNEAMLDVYRRAKADAGYNATRFLGMVSEMGGCETARTLLHAPTVSEGYTALWERGRLDLTVEAVILQPEWRDLFSEHARSRAANPDYDPRKPPLYVGMTGLDPATRFERHKYGVKDNRYVRRYGLRLRPDLYAGLNPLPYAEAQRMEWVLARELRIDGYAVWQK